KAAEVVAGPKIEVAAGEVGVVELVIADADVDLGFTEAVAAAGDEAAERGRDAEALGLIEEVLDEVGCLEVVERHLAGALQLVMHGLEERLLGGRGGLGTQGEDGRQRGCACNYDRSE